MRYLIITIRSLTELLGETFQTVNHMLISSIGCSGDAPSEAALIVTAHNTHTHTHTHTHHYHSDVSHNNRGQKLKVATSISESGTTIDPKTANPFTPRPSSASLSHKSSGPGLSGKLSSEIMADLDNLSNMPEGVEPSQWDRLVAARHKKVDSEQRVCVSMSQVGVNCSEKMLIKTECQDCNVKTKLPKKY